MHMYVEMYKPWVCDMKLNKRKAIFLAVLHYNCKNEQWFDSIHLDSERIAANHKLPFTK